MKLNQIITSLLETDMYNSAWVRQYSISLRIRCSCTQYRHENHMQWYGCSEDFWYTRQGDVQKSGLCGLLKPLHWLQNEKWPL